MSDSILEQVQSDTRDAMRAGERERVQTLRMIASALQQDAKLGEGDETKVLQRERKKRVEAAEAYDEGGRAEQAASERSEAEIIDAYLPAQLGDDELTAIVDAAIAESGAEGPQDMGKVMGPAMGKVQGRADGKRVSALVRERLGS